MDVKNESLQMQNLGNNINDLPDEVLEFILAFLPPYRDLQNCMRACRRWYNCGQSVMRKTSMNLTRAVTEFKIIWKNLIPLDVFPTITKRFSHAACIYRNSMYIFGGCTTNATAFNDLWRFDLSDRQWVRPLATGTYPVPKAYTSLTHYRDNLVLFGGWTYPSPSQYYQYVTMFNEIHFYNVTTYKWSLIKTSNSPPPMAGHSACMKGNEMIVFGGLVKAAAQQYHIQCCNDVWVLDLENKFWRRQPTSEPRPSPRYAQSLIPLDDDQFMLLGGAQTLHNRFVYSDCWILIMKGPIWIWKEITVKNKEWAAANIWCNPACRVGDKVVSLSRCRNEWNGAKPLVTSAVRLSSMNRHEGAPVSVRIEQNLRRPLDRDLNINGKRGVFTRQPLSIKRQGAPDEAVAGPSHESIPGDCCRNFNNNEIGNLSMLRDKLCQAKECDNGLDANISNDNNARCNKTQTNKNNGMKIVRQLQDANKYKMAAFVCDIPTNNVSPENDLINQRQIAHLENRHEPVICLAEQAQSQPAVKKLKRNTLTMHVLDISNVLNGNSASSVSWLCPRPGELNNAPEELVMYSLVKGNGELIMFGGVHNDINILNDLSSSHQHLYSNSLYFITPPKDVI